MAPLDLVFLGPPGAGKGTQARTLAERRGIPHISTGDLFRDAVGRGTPVGLEAKGFMDKGELVPDAVVCKMVEERLRHDDAEEGCILDGFPRTIAQAEALGATLSGLDRSLAVVISFTLDEAAAVERLGGRLTCKSCGAQFHARLNPPTQEGVCDACGEAALYVRADDEPEAIKKRMVEYREKTAPLADYYRERGLLREIDASPAIDTVQRSLERLLEGE